MTNSTLLDMNPSVKAIADPGNLNDALAGTIRLRDPQSNNQNFQRAPSCGCGNIRNRLVVDEGKPDITWSGCIVRLEEKRTLKARKSG